MESPEQKEKWKSIAAHTWARNSDGAPWSVQQHVAGLLGDSATIASNVRYSSSAPSAWSVFLVTDTGRLVRLLTEFDLDQYDANEEQSPFRQQHPVASTIRSAWVRRLSDAVRLDIGNVRQRVDAFSTPTGQLNLGGVRLLFGDGFEVDLEIDQASVYDNVERARSDTFLSAVRTHTGL